MRVRIYKLFIYQLLECHQRACHAVRQVLFVVSQTPLKPLMLIVTVHYYPHFRQGSQWVRNLLKCQRLEIQL